MADDDKNGIGLQKLLEQYSSRKSLVEIDAILKRHNAGEFLTTYDTDRLVGYRKSAQSARDTESKMLDYVAALKDKSTRQACITRFLKQDDDLATSVLARGATEGRVSQEDIRYAKRHFDFKRRRAQAKSAEGAADIRSRALAVANFGRMAMGIPNIAASFVGHELAPPGISRKEYDESKRIAAGEGQFGVGGFGRATTSLTQGGMGLLEMLPGFGAVGGAVKATRAPAAAGRLLGGSKLAQASAQSALTFAGHEGGTDALSKLFGTAKMAGQDWGDIPFNMAVAGGIGATMPLAKAGTAKIPGMQKVPQTGLGVRAKAALAEAPIGAGFGLHEFYETGDPWSALGTGLAFSGVSGAARRGPSAREAKAKVKKYRADTKGATEGKAKIKKKIGRLTIGIQSEAREAMLAKQKAEVGARGARGKGVAPTPVGLERKPAVEDTKKAAGLAAAKGDLDKLYKIRTEDPEYAQTAEYTEDFSRAMHRRDQLSAPPAVKKGAGLIVNKGKKRKFSDDSATEALLTRRAPLKKALDEVNASSSPEEQIAVMQGLDAQGNTEARQLLEKYHTKLKGYDKEGVPPSLDPTDGVADRMNRFMGGAPGDLWRVTKRSSVIAGGIPKNMWKGLMGYRKGRAESSWTTLGHLKAKGDMKGIVGFWDRVAGNVSRWNPTAPTGEVGRGVMMGEVDMAYWMPKMEKVSKPIRKARGKWMEEGAGFLDGFRKAAVDISGTEVGRRGLPAKTAANLDRMSEKWDKEHPKQKGAFREYCEEWRAALDYVRSKAAFANGIKETEAWGTNDFFPHTYRWMIDESGKITTNEDYNRPLPDYARPAALRFKTHKNFLPRMKNDPNYVLNTDVILKEYLPSALRYVNMKPATERAERMISGRYRKLGNDLDLLDQLTPGLASTLFDKPSQGRLPLGVKLNFTGTAGNHQVGGGKLYCKFSRGKLPAGIKLYSQKKGKWVEDPGKRLDLSTKPIKQRAPKDRFLYVQMLNDPKAPVLKIHLNKYTKQKIIIRKDGLAQLAQPTRLKAAYTWLQDAMGNESCEDFGSCEKFLAKTLDVWNGWAYHTTIGMLNTKVGITNITGGTASRIRTLGLHWATEGARAMDKTNKEYAELRKVVAELGAASTGRQWKTEKMMPTLEKYSSKHIANLYQKAANAGNEISFSVMKLTEYLNRTPTAYGAAARGLAPLEAGGLGLKWNKKFSHDDNLFHAKQIADRYMNRTAQKEFEKNPAWKAKEKKTWAEGVFKDALGKEIVNAVQQTDLLYGAMAPAIFRNRWLKPFTHLQQWSGRYVDRYIREDIPDFLTGRDPTKLARYIVTAALIDAAAHQFYLDDEYAINMSTVAQERLRDLPIAENVQALQSGGSLAAAGKYFPTGVQRPMWPPPPVSNFLGLCTAATSLNNGGGWNFIDDVRKEHGGGVFGTAVGRTTINVIKWLQAEESGDVDKPISVFHPDVPWAPGAKEMQRKSTKFEFFYSMFGPGVVESVQKEYDEAQAQRLRGMAEPMIKLKEHAVGLLVAGKRKEYEAYQKKHDFRLTENEAKSILRDWAKTPAEKKMTGVGLRDRIHGLEHMMKEKIYTKADHIRMAQNLFRSAKGKYLPPETKAALIRIEKVIKAHLDKEKEKK